MAARIPSRRAVVALASAVALAAGLAGCSPGNGLSLGRVSGKITYKGQPVPFGQIMFMPDDSKGTKGPPALGTISSDGSYTMSTEESGDGAVVGYHRVSVTGLDPKPVLAPSKNLDDMSDNEVMANKLNMGKALEKAKKNEGPTFRARDGSIYRIITPEKLTNPDTSSISIKVAGGSNTKNITIKEDGSVVIE
jgi:hypothetical protein